MDGFSNSNQAAEDKFMDLEREKLNLEKKKLEIEKAKIESEERQKREDRQHQFNMMKMILGATGQRQVVPGPSSAPYYNTASFTTPISKSQDERFMENDSNSNSPDDYSFFSL